MTPTLPEGLTIHCAECELVIPSDAPVPDIADCASVARARLSHHYPHEPLATQHSMAAATWSLIHHPYLSGHDPDPVHLEYHRRQTTDRKAQFMESVVRRAMTHEQVTAEAGHRRDGWLYRA